MTTIFVYISLKIHNLRYYNEQNTCQGREFRCVCVVLCLCAQITLARSWSIA